MTATNGTGRLSNAGVMMVHINHRNPAYPDLLARVRREDRRLSLIEREREAVWVPLEWVKELKGK
jgi:hypothetical protein